MGTDFQVNLPSLSIGDRENTLLEVATTLCVFLNLPAMFGVLPATLILVGAGADGWPVGVLLVAAAWTTWYAVIRWMEVRIQDATPLTLNLGGPGGPPH